MDQFDFRALCAELVTAFKDESTYTQSVEILDRARAALATPPPELSEAEGIAEWLYERGRLQDLGTKDWYFCASDLLKQLAAVKATPPPEPPSPKPNIDDILSLAHEYFIFRGNSHGDRFFATSIEAKTNPAQALLSFARDILERWGK